MKLQKLIAISCFLLLGNSMIAQDYALEFVSKLSSYQTNPIPEKTIYFLGAKEIIITNHTGKNIPFLDSIKMDKMLSQFNDQFASILQDCGFDVKNETDFNPKTLSDKNNTIRIAQLELELLPSVDSLVSQTDKNKVFYKELNAFRLNSWLECNGQTKEEIMFFNDITITESLEGDIETKYLNGKRQDVACYEIDYLNPNHAYILAYYLGREDARFFYDYLINKYVYQRSGGQDETYYYLDDHMLLRRSPFMKEGFQIMKNAEE